MRRNPSTPGALVALFLLCAAPAQAQWLTADSADSVVSVLAAHAGKPVTLKLRSGDELTGIVAATNDGFVHLRELTGREFFDAAVATGAIDAVIVRTRDR